MTGWPDRIEGILYGGDYNPEQWPEAVWTQDARLMKEAGVNMVSVGIFSWARLEPDEGVFDFGWLDRVLDLLHRHGVAANLATPTAAPPPWLSHRYPDTLPVTASGARQIPGTRQMFCTASGTYRAAVARIVRALAEHYRDHPALAMWHVHNEFGYHNAHCYCDASAEAFRRWLRDRYGDIETLNKRWGSDFWGLVYRGFDEIAPPRPTPTHASSGGGELVLGTQTYGNPTQQLDWWRFNSDQLLDCYRFERELLAEITPDIPATTQFILPTFKAVDAWSWSPHVDVASNDSYLLGAVPDSHVDQSLAGDLMRSLKSGAPWIVMEHSTSAVNWQSRNLAKAPGQLRRNSLAHVARGADGVAFFQWRASRAGAEKYHSAMVPHAGTDTKIWREVTALGRELRLLAEVQGSTIDSDVALLWDWNAWWAVELPSHPSVDVTFYPRLRQWYRALWRAGITVDFAHPDSDLSDYRLVLAPSSYLLADTAVERLRGYVHDGGTLALGYFGGLVDSDDQVRTGGYPGGLRELLGAWVEEFFPLLPDQRVRLDDGTSATEWTELVHTTTAERLRRFTDGPVAGHPALTRNDYGAGTAYYLATSPDDDALGTILGTVASRAGVAATVSADADVEVVRRRGKGSSYLFVINHGDGPASVPAAGREILTDTPVARTVAVPAGGVAVVRER